MSDCAGKKIVLTIHEPLSARVFFDCGIVRMLVEELGSRLEILSTFDCSEYQDWSARTGNIRIRQIDELPSAGHSAVAKMRATLDACLDRQIGFFPLAIRFNLRHGLHTDRMERGHNNNYLNLSHKGILPNTGGVYNFMFRWLYGRRRYINPDIVQFLQENASAIVTSHLQHPSTIPFILGARRLNLPLVGYIASWDHLVGKGVVYPHCKRYIVQNSIMRRDLMQYHAVAPDRIAITGWPQTDVFSKPKSRAQYDALIASFGLDSAKPCVLITGNSVTNAPYEPAFFKRVVQWWETSGACARMNLIFRPHPKDVLWKERYDVNLMRTKKGIHLQEPSYLDMDVLALMLQHADCVVTNAGTILLDSLVNNRPVVSVQYDEGCPPGSSMAVKNIVGLHYKELVASGAFYVAKNFDDVVKSIELCLSNPEALSDRRRKVCHEVVGDVDGNAASRVVSEIVNSIS